MRSIRLLVLVLGLMPIIATTWTKSKPLVFTHVTVIDGTGAAAQSDMVVVRHGRKRSQSSGSLAKSKFALIKTIYKEL